MAGKTGLKPSEEPENRLEKDPSLPEAHDPFDLTAGLESPARRLQHYLGNELGSKFGEDVLSGRWSARRSIAFVFVTCSLFWLIMWLAIRALF